MTARSAAWSSERERLNAPAWTRRIPHDSRRRKSARRRWMDLAPHVMASLFEVEVQVILETISAPPVFDIMRANSTIYVMCDIRRAQNTAAAGVMAQNRFSRAY
jgi:hypothetical protein